MSIESIIGITSGLIAIAGAIYGSVCWLRDKLKGKTTIELFNQLTNRSLTDLERRKILKDLNKSTLINNRIKDGYIQKFVLDKRGRETVLFDICDGNDIEPTDDICKGLIGASMPSLNKKYHEKRQKSGTEPTLTSVSNNEQNNPITLKQAKREQIVYMSELLKTNYTEACDRLISILEKHNVKYAFLKGTKDIWCRDYMPVQTESGKFIQFRYNPSYLKGNVEWEASRSDVKEVCRLNNINAQFSDINLDGGNVLICDGRVIISDRIFVENPDKDKNEIVDELSKLLESEIIIIPAQKSDMTGHADGMVRFVNKTTLLGNNLDNEFKYWREGMKKVIEQFNLKYINMPFFEARDAKHPLSAIGLYVNYLEVNKLIVLPVFGRNDDDQAISILKEVFPDKAIETIDFNDVAQEGGLLNCTTWVVTV